MIDFDLGPDLTALRDRVRAFVDLWAGWESQVKSLALRSTSRRRPRRSPPARFWSWTAA